MREFYGKPAPSALDGPVKDIVKRYLFDDDPPTWRDWLGLAPGSGHRLGILYGTRPQRQGDWLVIA